MSYNLFAHEEDDENHYGYRKDPHLEAQKRAEKEFVATKFAFELYTWPQIVKIMKAGKALRYYDAYDTRMYGSYKQKQEVEAYRKAFSAAKVADASKTDEDKNSESSIVAANDVLVTKETVKPENNKATPVEENEIVKENTASAFQAPLNPDYNAPAPAPLLISNYEVVEGDDIIEHIDEPKAEEYTYTEEAAVIATNEEIMRWNKMPLAGILSELKPGYTIADARKDFRTVNKADNTQLDQWIKTAIISYGWRPGAVPPLLNITASYRTDDGTPLIETPDENEAFRIAVQEYRLKEFQSFYWKNRATAQVQFRTIYYGSPEVQYNKRHINQAMRLQLADDLFLASGNIQLYNNAADEKYTGEAFVLLVKSAQEVLFYDQSQTLCDGKLGPKTMSELSWWVQQNKTNNFDAYSERLARRYAKLKAVNDKARESYNIQKDAERDKLISRIQVGGDTKDRYATYNTSKFALEKSPFKQDEAKPEKLPFVDDGQLVFYLISQYPRSSKDKPMPAPIQTKPAESYMGHVIKAEYKNNNDFELVKNTYINLQTQKQEKADAPQFQLAEQSVSNFTNNYLVVGEQHELIKSLLPQTNETGLPAQLTNAASKAEYINWLNACAAFFAVKVTDMGKDGENKADGIHPLMQPIIAWRKEKDKVNLNKLFEYDKIRQINYNKNYFPAYSSSYNEVARELIEAGSYLISDLKTILRNTATAGNRSRNEALENYDAKQGKHLRREKLMKSAYGTFKSVKAVFKTDDQATKANQFNPASGQAQTSVYPLELFIEQFSENDFSLHLLLSDEEENNIHVSGSDIHDCMENLAYYQDSLPDGTIYYYNPFETGQYANTNRYAQRIEGHLKASDVFGYVGLGLAVLAALPTGGTSLLIAGSAFAGVASSACFLYERNAVGQLKQQDILLESGNIVASLLPGINALARAGTFTKLSSRLARFEIAAASHKVLQLTAVVDLGVVAANAITLSQDIIDQLAEVDQAIKEGRTTQEEAAAMRHRILMQAIFTGSFIILAAKGDADDLRKKFPHTDAAGIRYREEIVSGITVREYESGRQVHVMPDGSLKDVSPVKKSTLQLPEHNRPYSVHTDGKGNYIKKYSDTGEQININKQQFTSAGGTETGRYKVSRETDAGGNAKYTRTNLDSGTQEVIGENVFRKGKIKSYIQTDPPNQAKHLDAPEIEPNIVAKAATPDGHTIKVAKTGDIGICSECTDLREEFAEELIDNAELDEKLDSICAETDPKQKALLAAEFRQKLLAERWKRNPFREDQLTRRTVGDVEYLDVQLDDGRKVTLKKDANGDWKVERWSGGAPTMMNEEVLGRMPGGNDNNQTAKSINNKLDFNLESSIENIDSSDVTRKLYRIDKPGEGNVRDINKYISLETIPEKYKQESNFEQLAEDPDQGGNISPKTRVEAMAGIEAVNIGAITPPITRGPKGIEFYDGNGNPWDVKTPPSPYNNEFIFNPKKSGESILNELRNKGTPPGYFNNSKTNEPVKRSVILNSTFLNDADHKSLWEWLNVNLTQDELQRIVEVKTQL